MTTLELTTASFAFLMFCTSAAWFYKPCITKPQFIDTKDYQSIQSIREFSQQHVGEVILEIY
jgi:hypothetical protein